HRRDNVHLQVRFDADGVRGEEHAALRQRGHARIEGIEARTAGGVSQCPPLPLREVADFLPFLFALSSRKRGAREIGRDEPLHNYFPARMKTARVADWISSERKKLAELVIVATYPNLFLRGDLCIISECLSVSS